MEYTIPVDVYKRLEEKFGRETASDVVSVLGKSIDRSIVDSKDRLKIEISEELKKELASKYDIELVRKDMDLLRMELKKDMKIWSITIIAVIIILNQNSLEFIARLLGILK